jgi:hypothetical protein
MQNVCLVDVPIRPAALRIQRDDPQQVERERMPERKRS